MELCFEVVLRLFEVVYWGCIEDVWGCIEVVLRMFEVVLRLYWGCLRLFWGLFEVVLRLYWGCLRLFWGMFLRLYWGLFLRMFWGCLRLFDGCIEDVWGCIEVVLRMFEVVLRLYWGCLSQTRLRTGQKWLIRTSNEVVEILRILIPQLRVLLKMFFWSNQEMCIALSFKWGSGRHILYVELLKTLEHSVEVY